MGSGGAGAIGRAPAKIAVIASLEAADPLLTAPHDLRPGLRAKTNWAHLDPVGPGWTVAARCYDEKPVLIYRTVGKGLLIVTNYFRFAGGSTVGGDLLQNAMSLAAATRQGMQVGSVAWGERENQGERQCIQSSTTCICDGSLLT